MATRVLVVVGDPDFLEMLDAVLSDEGYRVARCPVVAEAQEMARQFLPSVVIVDIVPWNDNGWSLIEQITSDPSIAGIHVVASVLAPPDELPRAVALLQRGCNFLVKPFDIYDLLALLAKVSTNCEASHN